MADYEMKDIRHLIRGLEDALQDTYDEYTEVIGRRIRVDVEERMLPMALGAYEKAAKNNIEWVFRAQALKSDKRKSLQYLRVQNGIAECTNGHMILQAPTKWLDGFYLDGVHEIYQDINFPDTAEASPNYENWEPCTINKQIPSRVEINNNIVINAEYFLAVVDDEILGWEVAYDISNPRSAFKMRNTRTNRKAVIMPLRVKFLEGLTSS